jgi:hypothetical protein
MHPDSGRSPGLLAADDRVLPTTPESSTRKSALIQDQAFAGLSASRKKLAGLPESTTGRTPATQGTLQAMARADAISFWRNEVPMVRSFPDGILPEVPRVAPSEISTSYAYPGAQQR